MSATQRREVSAATRAPSQGWRPDIQGLRAVAVVVVVAFHAGLPIPGGFVGVDVFFVISGFVITGMLKREWASQGRIRLGHFYMRRFKRLTPALALMVSVTVLLSALVLSPFGTQQTAAQTAIGAMLLVANVVISRSTGGYFDAPAATNPLLNTWSLSVEEQFYLVFPLLLVAGWALAMRSRRLRAIPLLIVTAVAGVSLALCLADSFDHPLLGFQPEIKAFYSPLARAWEFAIGAALALILDKWAVSSRSRATLLGAVGVAGLGSSFWLISADTPFPGPWTLLPVGATLLLVLAGTEPTNAVTQALGSRPAVAVGDWSYSVYLWHWPLITFSAIIWPKSSMALVLAALVSFAPALASYRWVEQPIRNIREASRTRLAGIVAATLVPPIVLAAGLWMASQHGFWLASVQRYQQAVALEHAGWLAGCGNTIAQSKRAPGQCSWNVNASGAPIYLVGDSHADHLGEAVIGAGQELNRPVVISTTTACPFIAIAWTFSLEGPKWNDDCRAYVSGTQAWLASQPPGTVVISSIAGNWLNPDFVFDTADGQPIPSPEERETLYANALRKTVVGLYQSGHDVVLVQDGPRGISNPQMCPMVAILKDSCTSTVPIAGFLSNREVDRQIINNVASDTGAKVLDLLLALCEGESCASVRDGVVLYRDNDHLTVPASMWLAPAVAAILDSTR